MIDSPAQNEVPFRPLRRVDGYLPLEDHGLIGDGTTNRSAAFGTGTIATPGFATPPLQYTPCGGSGWRVKPGPSWLGRWTTWQSDQRWIVYDVEGRRPPPEQCDDELEGYRRSRPVRWGNDAIEQHQHDVFGEILDCAYQWMMRGGALAPELWSRLCECIEAARREWRTLRPFGTQSLKPGIRIVAA